MKNAIKPKVRNGKKLRAIKVLLDCEKMYVLDEAVKFLQTNKVAKFDETLEVVMCLGVDPKQSDQVVRGVVSMPNGIGKEIRAAVFAKDSKADEATKAGADIVGADDLVEKILAGEIRFDVCIATPDMMGVVGKVAKILGPKGLMPNPKLGTVTPNVTEAIGRAKAGQVEFKAEKAGIIHAGVGKLSFTDKQLAENIKALVSAVVKAKPAASKGTYLKDIYLSATMGPSLHIDLSSVA